MGQEMGSGSSLHEFCGIFLYVKLYIICREENNYRYSNEALIRQIINLKSGF